MPLTTSALPGGAADDPAEALRVSQLLAAHTDAHGVVRIRVRVTHQLPRVDLLEHLAVLDLDGAARVLLLLQVDDGDALVAQLLIAA